MTTKTSGLTPSGLRPKVPETARETFRLLLKPAFTLITGLAVQDMVQRVQDANEMLKAKTKDSLLIVFARTATGSEVITVITVA